MAVKNACVWKCLRGRALKHKAHTARPCKGAPLPCHRRGPPLVQLQELGEREECWRRVCERALQMAVEQQTSRASLLRAADEAQMSQGDKQRRCTHQSITQELLCRAACLALLLYGGGHCVLSAASAMCSRPAAGASGVVPTTLGLAPWPAPKQRCHGISAALSAFQCPCCERGTFGVTCSASRVHFPSAEQALDPSDSRAPRNLPFSLWNCNDWQLSGGWKQVAARWCVVVWPPSPSVCVCLSLSLVGSWGPGHAMAALASYSRFATCRVYWLGRLHANIQCLVGRTGGLMPSPWLFAWGLLGCHTFLPLLFSPSPPPSSFTCSASCVGSTLSPSPCGG